jgi:DNA-directed RNA polymerase specialized sigma24 family protein
MKYEDIRRRLTKYFEWNQCAAPEDLADEALDRVAAKSNSEEIREVDKYCFGVATFVRREDEKRRRRVTHTEDLAGGEDALCDDRNQPGQIEDSIDRERRLACLRRCLAELVPGDGDLVLQYYGAEEEKQKTFRRRLAEKAGLNMGALRTRTSRLRGGLEECVKRCLESRQREEKCNFAEGFTSKRRL